VTQVDLSAPPSPGHEQPAERAGRMCPVDYRYPASVFDRPAELTADTLYVAGGLYGNLAALDDIERLAAQENALVVFNGDFHWFDAEPDWFDEIARRVARHHAIRGNVETELARRSGVRLETISRLESGKHTPRQETLLKLDRALSGK